MEAPAKEYVADLRRQYPELVEAERAIFAERYIDEEVIVISDDEKQGGDNGGKHGGGKDEEEFDVEKWQCIFPDSDDGGTGPVPMDDGMSWQDWLDLYHGDDEE